MAKIAFSKLGLTKNTEVKTVVINGQTIEVKQYLPVNDKLELISKVLIYAHDANNFSNPVKLEVLGSLEIIHYYTNISFTDKQKEDLPKLYDLFEGSGALMTIIEAIPRDEYSAIINGINESSAALYSYKNSAVGMMETISTDYSNLSLDANQILQDATNPQAMELLKDVLSKLG